MASVMRQYPVWSYFALAYAFTWTFQLLSLFVAVRSDEELSNEDNFRHVRDMVALEASADQVAAVSLFNLGQVGPVVAAFALTAVLYGRFGLRDLAARTAKWRIAPGWYGAMLGIPVLMVGASLAAAFLTGGFEVGPFTPEVAWVAFLPFALYMFVFNGLAEEPGWRGFALPHLQAEHSAWRASWILGIGWGLWHVPFTVYYNLDEPVLLVASFFGLTFGIVGWTIVNTWLYNQTSSVLLIMLLHAWNNTLQSFFILSQPNFQAQSVFVLLPWGIALLLARRYGEGDLAAIPRPRWWPGRYPVEQREHTPARAGAPGVA